MSVAYVSHGQLSIRDGDRHSKMGAIIRRASLHNAHARKHVCHSEWARSQICMRVAKVGGEPYFQYGK